MTMPFLSPRKEFGQAALLIIPHSHTKLTGRKVITRQKKGTSNDLQELVDIE